MLKYFLQEQNHLSQKNKHNIKKKFIKRRQYRPFHLDCSYTKKKLCYCASHPITNLVDENKVQLWKNYEKVNNFFKGIQDKQTKEEQKAFQRCKEKIKMLSSSQLAEYIRTFRNEKNLHMGQNGEYDTV